METRYKSEQANASHSSSETMYDPPDNGTIAGVDSASITMSLNPQLLDPTPQAAPVPDKGADKEPTTSAFTTAPVKRPAGGKAAGKKDAGELVPVPTRKAGPRTKKTDPNHIKRPPNAFILFRSHFCSPGDTPGFQRDAVYAPSAHQLNLLGITDHRHISRIVSHLWRSLYLWQRQYWEQKAEIIKKRHQVMYPDYKYRPQHRRKRGSSVPISVSPDAEERDLVEREKCQSIAQALIVGDTDFQSDVQESVEFLRQKNAELPSASLKEFDSQKDAPTVVKKPKRKAASRRNKTLTPPRMATRFEQHEPLTITLHAPGSTASLASEAPSHASVAPSHASVAPVGQPNEPFQFSTFHVLPPLPAPAVDNSSSLVGATTVTGPNGFSNTGVYSYNAMGHCNSSNTDYCAGEGPQHIHNAQSVHDLSDVSYMPDDSYARDALLASEMQQQSAHDDAERGDFRHQMATHEEYTSYTRAYASRVEAAGAAAARGLQSIGPYESSHVSLASSSSSSVGSYSKFSTDSEQGAFAAMQQDMTPRVIDPRNLMASAVAPSYRSPPLNVEAHTELSSRPRTRRAVAAETALAAQAAHAAAMKSPSIVPRSADPMLYVGHRSNRGQDAYGYHAKREAPVFVSPWDNNKTPLVQEDVGPFTFKASFAGSMSEETQLIPASPEPSTKADSISNDSATDVELSESKNERVWGAFDSQGADGEVAKADDVRRGSKSWMIKLKQAGLGKRLSKQFKDFGCSAAGGNGTVDAEKNRLLTGDSDASPKEEGQDTLLLDIRTNRTPRNSITSYMSGVLQNWHHRLSFKRGSEATIIADASKITTESKQGERVDEEKVSGV